MFYSNGGGTWTDKANWLNNESHCTWKGISCDAKSQVTSVLLTNNNISGSIADLSDLSVLSSVNTIALDMNGITGPIPELLCGMSDDISLQVDDTLCNDPGIGEGCCDKVRTGDATIDEASVSVLGTANCPDITEAADVNACTWMKEKANHPPNDKTAHQSTYLVVRN